MTELPVVWIALGVVILIVLLARARKPRRRAGRGGTGGVDVEGDLVRACRGDRAMAARLIAHELEHSAELSRTGAALMALAKLRDDQR
jgi:hypothetical protein